MEQRKVYVDNLAACMRGAGRENWKAYDMQDICEMADLWGEWLKIRTRTEAEELSIKAAQKLAVEIRHII